MSGGWERSSAGDDPEAETEADEELATCASCSCSCSCSSGAWSRDGEGETRALRRFFELLPPDLEEEGSPSAGGPRFFDFDFDLDAGGSPTVDSWRGGLNGR